MVRGTANGLSDRSYAPTQTNGLSWPPRFHQRMASGPHRQEAQSKRPFQAPTSKNVPSRVCSTLGPTPLIFSSSRAGMMRGFGKDTDVRPAKDPKNKGRSDFS